MTTAEHRTFIQNILLHPGLSDQRFWSSQWSVNLVRFYLVRSVVRNLDPKLFGPVRGPKCNGPFRGLLFFRTHLVLRRYLVRSEIFSWILFELKRKNGPDQLGAVRKLRTKSTGHGLDQNPGPKSRTKCYGTIPIWQISDEERVRMVSNISNTFSYLILSILFIKKSSKEFLDCNYNITGCIIPSFRSKTTIPTF